MLDIALQDRCAHLFLVKIKIFEINKETQIEIPRESEREREREGESEREQHSPLSPKESEADSMIDGFVKGSLGVP